MYYDPNGYKLKIPTRSIDKEFVLLALKSLIGSAAVITVDGSGFVTKIYFPPGTKKYSKSLTLVLRIISNSKTVTIMVANHYDYHDVGRVVHYSGSHHNLMTVTDVRMNECSWYKTPDYIALAHELIHADRYLRGSNHSKLLYVNWSYRTTSGVKYTNKIRKEEAATVGLGGWHTAYDITENQIREEHGIFLRGAY